MTPPQPTSQEATGLRWWSTLLIYGSVAAVLFHLWRSDLLAVPDTFRPGLLMLSLALLVAGFAVSPGYWRSALVEKGFAVDWPLATASLGLTVFAKYLPGKVWSVLGPSGYVAGRIGGPAVALATLSLNAQLLMIWAGALIGGLGLMVWSRDPILATLMGASWVLLSLALFSRGIPWLLRRLGRAEGQLPSAWIPPGRALRMLPWLVAPWLCWCAGFLALTPALTSAPATLALAPAFALAATAGILVPVAPGGLGVREAVLAAYLIGVGLPAAEATTLSVASRLWFLVGEAAFFLIGGWSARRRHGP